MPVHGIATIYTLRRFHIFMRRTTISHFAFLISNFCFFIQAKLSSGIEERHALNNFSRKGCTFTFTYGMIMQEILVSGR